MGMPRMAALCATAEQLQSAHVILQLMFLIQPAVPAGIIGWQPTSDAKID
jgi:hypothetical protein